MRNSTAHKMKVLLIRHGETAGNLQKRYIGRTDEPLCGQGRQTIAQNAAAGKYPAADKVFASPMKRCIETAKLIYPENELTLDDGLKEIDFGLFEGKSYSELSGTLQYQQWIESGGTMPFPKGESREQFVCRTVSAFERLIAASSNDADCVAFIVHGGSIMAVLSAYNCGSYFDFQCANGEGFVCEIERRTAEADGTSDGTAENAEQQLVFKSCRRL